jgi:hypothetical protein
MAVLRLGPADTIVAAAGSQNNVDTPNEFIDSLNRIYVDTTAGNATFTGLVAAADGQLMWILNSGPNSLTLSNENGASDAANQFTGSGDLTISAGDSMMIYYDASLTKWVMGI